MFVAVPPGRDEKPVRVFATFTEDLERLTDWLEQCGVTTVAPESTGVYWIPLFEILEQRGIRPCLVNARHMKNVPGRRTDWNTFAEFWDVPFSLPIFLKICWTGICLRT